MAKPGVLPTNASFVRLNFFCVGSFGVVHVLGVFLSVYALELREISPTLVLVPGAYSKNKNIEAN